MEIFKKIRLTRLGEDNKGKEQSKEHNYQDKVGDTEHPHDAGSPIAGSQENRANSEKYAYFVLLVMLFLLPVVFAPTLSIPFQFTKIFLAFFGILISFVLFLSTRLKEGTLDIPRNFLFFSVWLLPLSYFVSSIFSINPNTSFVGQNFEIDTFSFILLMSILVSLVVMLMKKREQILNAYLVLFGAFIVVWIFHGLRLFFGADFLSFNVLNLPTTNILGKWNDLSIFFGLATVLTLVTLAGVQLSKFYEKILYVVLIISLFFLAVVNFFLVWIVVGVFAVGFFLHSVGVTRFSRKNESEGIKKESTEETGYIQQSASMKPASLLVLIVSVIFIVGSNSYSSFVSDFFNISQIEARPSWQTTVNIGKEVYKEDIIFGSGPNTFVKTWALHKPREVNETVFWNVDFVSGIGIIPTSFITVGLIGALAWTIFLGLFLYSGIRMLLFSSMKNRFSYYISLSSFLAGLYLWIMTISYTPNIVLITLAFFFTGIFIASLRHHKGRFKEQEVNFANNQKVGFVIVLVLTSFLLASLAGLYVVGKEYIAVYQFQKGVISFNSSGDLDVAERGALRAINISNRDRYYRLLADVSIARLVALQSETEISEVELRSRFQTFLANAIEYGQEATRVDPSNYQNWVTFGRVYASVVPLGIEGAYENALTMYERAVSLYPKNPALALILARLELAHGDSVRAREHIAESLQFKTNYTEAIFLLSQIEIQEGNINQAIKSVEAATVIAPNNPVIFFQLGLLRYNERDNREAIEAFERAVRLNNSYSNARYFLGLTYNRVGRTDEAIEQFERVEELNQNNTEVKTILENLRAGRNPFASEDKSVEPPEERDELPVEEPIEEESEGDGIITD